MSALCPGCAKRDADADEKTGLCAQCRSFESVTASVPDILLLTPEELVEALKRLVPDILDSLLDPSRKPTLDAWGAGKAAVIISVNGATIERLPSP